MVTSFLCCVCVILSRDVCLCEREILCSCFCCLVLCVHLLLIFLSACSHLSLWSSLFLPPVFFIFFLYVLLHPTSVPITFYICSLSVSLSPSAFPLFLSSIPRSFTQERNAVIFLLLPKPPLENIGLVKVKGKGLKRKVFHASCEWYAETENGKVLSPSFLPPLRCSLCCHIVTCTPVGLICKARCQISALISPSIPRDSLCEIHPQCTGTLTSRSLQREGLSALISLLKSAIGYARFSSAYLSIAYVRFDLFQFEWNSQRV